MDSKNPIRGILKGFAALISLAWAGSLAFMIIDAVSSARRLASPGLVVLALVILGVEAGIATVSWSHMKKSASVVQSWWTPASIALAVLLVVGNIAAGMAMGSG